MRRGSDGFPKQHSTPEKNVRVSTKVKKSEKEWKKVKKCDKSIMYNYDVIQIYIKILYINIKFQHLITWEKLNEFSTSWKTDDEI